MKKVVAVLLSVVMLVCLLPCFAVSVSADALYIRKVVSVVYDDSGSMNHYDKSKWANANYAMQAFCGMLNAEDKLYISYMSEVTDALSEGTADRYVPQEVDLSSGGIQRSVNHIRNLTKASDYTPFKAVERAYHQLTQVQDSNPNTQYWLVIITDGLFNVDGDPNTTKELDKRLSAYANAKMPNGTNPQITFMGIEQIPPNGQTVAPLVMPTDNPSKGIYTYSAKDSDQIIGVMSDMAAQISGRSRVESSAVQKVNDTTLRVSSEIPLLNIAVLSQRTDAKVTYACYTGEGEIKRSRQAALRYDRNPNFTDLLGSACLVGDSQQVIMAGSYDITFDKAVNLNDVVVLFEPALETRMTISVNGTPITDYTELQNTMAGDKISVSCKLYEMGTNNEVSPSLLPPGTTFQIVINENGQQVHCEVGQDMVLENYELKNLDTEVVAQVIIEGFRPIEYRETFTPTPYVPRVVYTMDVAYGSGTQSVKLDNIGTNTDLTLVYTVYANGEPMTNPAEVQALKPTIAVTPAGNNGVLTYSADGKIVFTPNVAPTPAAGVDSFEVQATCTLENGVSATQKYTVLVALYEIFPLTVNGNIRKNEFFGNTVGASFYITKDGVRLTKSQVESQAAGVLNETYSHLDTRIEVAADGTITVIPHAAEEHKMCWLINWWWYWFDLPGEDVSVTLSHPYGTATTIIDVVEADTGYIIWNVIAPFVVCILLLILIAMYVWGDVNQPWFQNGRALYVGNLRFEPNQGGYDGNRGHAISGVRRYTLSGYNCWWWYLIPWPVTQRVSVAAHIEVSPTRGEAINCHFKTWTRVELHPVDEGTLRHPEDLRQLAGNAKVLHVEEIRLDATRISNERTLEGVNATHYWIAPNPQGGYTIEDDITTIMQGKVVGYARTRN